MQQTIRLQLVAAHQKLECIVIVQTKKSQNSLESWYSSNYYSAPSQWAVMIMDNYDRVMSKIASPFRHAFYSSLLKKRASTVSHDRHKNYKYSAYLTSYMDKIRWQKSYFTKYQNMYDRNGLCKSFLKPNFSFRQCVLIYEWLLFVNNNIQ